LTFTALALIGLASCRVGGHGHTGPTPHERDDAIQGNPRSAASHVDFE